LFDIELCSFLLFGQWADGKFSANFSVDFDAPRAHRWPMVAASLPETGALMDAFYSRDASYDGVFYTGVRTTGIFCRPSCSARKPKPENIEFFQTARDAMFAGYRACRRCHPLEAPGETPAWLGALIEAVDADPARRWTDEDLRSLGIHPDRVRRWFKANHGMTFHAYARARRLGTALERIREGDRVVSAALDHGYESLSGFNAAVRGLIGAPPTASGELATVILRRITTPLGPMLAGAVGTKVCFLEFADRRMLEHQLAALAKRLECRYLPGNAPVLQALNEQLDAYFSGRLQCFDVPLESPGTEFQQAVWGQQLKIPYGETRSYADVAEALGRPTATRAVARANGTNRLAILIPCHRVIGKDGSLTGYAGSLWRKQWLLELEQG
jgi:AraC family transcriptional regulator of adaptative response/methylated-DNA-[protein]-cysteine methyltransferase